MRILIIEDEHSLREQLTTRLKHEGYAVDGATDGEEGLYLVTEFPFDAAIIDLGLPKLSGIEVIRKARALGNKKKAYSIWEEALKLKPDDGELKKFLNTK